MKTERPPLLALDLPLQGRQLIEASAGTGKTWTLAALYVRLVLGHGRGGLAQGLLPPQILVMTFTEAATAELRDRIRERLQQATQAFDPSSTGPSDDEFLHALWQDTPSEQRTDAAQRLRLAVSWMDEAAIHTIHGWSMKSLREHAFASRSLFDLQRLQEPDQLWLEMARSHVRRFIYPLSWPQLQALHAEQLSTDPQKWVDALSDLRKAHEREPQAEVDLNVWPSPQTLLQSLVTWLPQEEALLQKIRGLLDRQLMQDIQEFKHQHPGVLGHLRKDLLPGILSRLIDWSEGREPEVKPKDLEKMGYSAMTEKKWPPDRKHLALLAIDEWRDLQKQKPDSVRASLLEHALHHMLQAYEQAKDQAGLFDFHDLLKRLHQAVNQPNSELASRLLAQYPVALVDEFQDTDPWQYETLNRIYAPDSPGTLIMIGDPKQAIYSFRGADLGTYVKARQDAHEWNEHSLHSLHQNRRSTPELLAVLNALFQLNPQLFGPDIAFEAATPSSIESSASPSTPNPVQVVVSEGWEGANAEKHRTFLLHHMIQCMVSLLQDPQVQPQDMAVLVRSQHQAQAVIKALARSRIPAVYLSDRSRVYESGEAHDLWLLLKALAEPRRVGCMRAALGTPLWGLSEQELMHLTHSDAAWDVLIEQALGWHQHWMGHGVLAMLRLWLLQTGAAGRLLAQDDGERRLANLLHLGELLQQASHPMTAQGIATLPHATVRHLGQEIRRSAQGEGPTQTRLESDQARVKVVTFHKSKGLQYPHVFIPFLSSGEGAPEQSKDEDEGPIDRSKDVLEDTRLLYVAMTRAERSLWLGIYPHRKEFQKGQSSALCRWLQRTQAQTPWAGVWRALADQIPGLSVNVPGSSHPTTWSPPAPVALQGGPKPLPHLQIDPWWSASFSGLTRSLLDTVNHSPRQDSDIAREVDSEQRSLTLPPGLRSDTAGHWQSFGAGARYGTALHDLLQWQADRDWPLASSGPTAAWHAMIERQSGLSEAERAMVTPWMQHIIQTPLPIEGAAPLVLADLRQPQHTAEMPFHFGVQSLSVQRLDAMICADLHAGLPRPALQPATLRGMVNGFIDLVFQHDGRYWVLDYKSNWLDHYDASSLQNALLDKRYDVQSVLYLLALHRLLKVRLTDYDPTCHLGGAVYLFIRGIGMPGQGVVMQQASVALILAIDQAMGGHDQGGA